jgi:hypothetical protein
VYLTNGFLAGAPYPFQDTDGQFKMFDKKTGKMKVVKL